MTLGEAVHFVVARLVLRVAARELAPPGMDASVFAATAIAGMFADLLLELPPDIAADVVGAVNRQLQAHGFELRRKLH